MEEDLELFNWDFEREEERLDEMLDIAELTLSKEDFLSVKAMICGMHDQLILKLF